MNKLICPLTSLLLSILISIPILCSESTARNEKTPPRIFYIFAHQDDELDIIARMALDTRQGRDVYAAWTTNGDLSAPPEVREKESRDCMKFIGVPQDHLFFLGYHDMGTLDNLESILRDLEKIVNEIKPDIFFTSAYEGGHVDHDVASLLGAILADAIPGTQHYEFSLYNVYKGKYRVGELLPRDDVRTEYVPLDDELLDIKLKSLKLYPSQAALLNMLMATTNKKILKKKGEPYRLAPKYNFLERPVDEPLGYETMVKRTTPFSDWLGAVKPFLAKKQ